MAKIGFRLRYLLLILVILVPILVIAFGVFILLLWWDINSTSKPENWAPWFSFYRSKSCVVSARDTVTNNCYLLGSRVKNFSDSNNKLTMFDLINSLNLTVKNTTTDSEESSLNPNDWNCYFYDSDHSSGNRSLGLRIYKPNRGDRFECWPTESLDQNKILSY